MANIRPVHYLLVYIACMYFIAIMNVLQVILWAIVPGFVPSLVVAFCGMGIFLLNMYVEHQINKNNIELEDLL